MEKIKLQKNINNNNINSNKSLEKRCHVCGDKAFGNVFFLFFIHFNIAEITLYYRFITN